MQMGFYFDQTRCTGCFTCVVACKDWHDVPPGPASWMRVTTVEKGKYPDLFVDPDETREYVDKAIPLVEGAVGRARRRASAVGVHGPNRMLAPERLRE